MDRHGPWGAMRGLGSTEPAFQGSEPVRVCGECHRAKTIRGVWYLVPGRSEVPFVCEACFGIARQAPAVI